MTFACGVASAAACDGGHGRRGGGPPAAAQPQAVTRRIYPRCVCNGWTRRRRRARRPESWIEDSERGSVATGAAADFYHGIAAAAGSRRSARRSGGPGHCARLPQQHPLQERARTGRAARAGRTAQPWHDGGDDDARRRTRRRSSRRRARSGLLQAGGVAARMRDSGQQRDFQSRKFLTRVRRCARSWSPGWSGWVDSTVGRWGRYGVAQRDGRGGTPRRCDGRRNPRHLARRRRRDTRKVRHASDKIGYRRRPARRRRRVRAAGRLQMDQRRGARSGSVSAPGAAGRHCRIVRDAALIRCGNCAGNLLATADSRDCTARGVHCVPQR